MHGDRGSRGSGKKQQLTLTRSYYKGKGREGESEELARQEVTAQRNRNCTLLLGVKSEKQCGKCLQKITSVELYDAAVLLWV